MYLNLMKQPICAVCGADKVKEVSSTFGALRIEEWYYVLLFGEILGRVFCKNCGLVYHEDSI